MVAVNEEKQDKLSHEELRRLLHYNPETGQFTWRVARGGKARKGSVAGTKTPHTGYSQLVINRTIYKQHRLAWFYMTGKWPSDQIDHINGIRDDNRFHNLREATCSQNLHNVGLKSSNSTGYKGVSLHKPSGKYVANITVKGRQLYLGIFEAPEEAHAAYKKKALEIAGQFARWK